MNTTSFLGYVLVFLVSVAWAKANGLFGVIMEERFAQTGPEVVESREVGFTAEVQRMPDVTGAQVSGDAGALLTTPQALSADDDMWVYKATYGTAGELTAAHPLDGNYTLGVTGVAGSPVVISAPGVGSYADYSPVAPIFSISGLSGFWRTVEGKGEFVFEVSAANSFTVTLNDYSAVSQGDHFAVFVEVWDQETGSTLGEVEDGIQPSTETFVAPVFTFSFGLEANNDGNDRTVGFVAGSRLELEAAFYNLTSYGDAGRGDGSEAAFAFSAGTSFTLVAVPEPRFTGMGLGVVALGLAWMRGRRKTMS